MSWFFFKKKKISSFHNCICKNLLGNSLVWTCTDSSRKCLHSDICLNARWICHMIMNTKWINNDMWIMNTIYSTSDKIVSFLACTCINCLPHASVTIAQALFWHITAIYCLWIEWQPSWKLVSQARSTLHRRLFFLITADFCVNLFQKSLTFRGWSLILLSVIFVTNNLKLLWGKNTWQFVLSYDTI